MLPQRNVEPLQYRHGLDFNRYGIGELVRRRPSVLIGTHARRDPSRTAEWRDAGADPGALPRDAGCVAARAAVPPSRAGSAEHGRPYTSLQDALPRSTQRWRPLSRIPTERHADQELGSTDRVGFEPTERGNRSRALQARLFNHSSTCPRLVTATGNLT